MPMAAAIAAAKVHADAHFLWRSGEDPVGHGDIFVDQHAPVIAASCERGLHVRIAEFGESGLVNLDITAASAGERVKLACESIDRIRPELIHILVRTCHHCSIAAAEM